MPSVVFNPMGFDKNRLLDRMRKSGLDAVLLSSPENVYYTSGYPSIPGAGNPILFGLRNHFPFYTFITADGRVTLFAWFGALMFDVGYGVDHVEMYADRNGAREVIKNFFAGRDLRGWKIGIESTCPAPVCRLIEERGGAIGHEEIDVVMEHLRAVKSPAEIDAIRKATRVIENTITGLAGIITPGITRPEVIREAKSRMLANGADGIGHVTVSFGTSNPEVEIEETLGKNTLVALDIGADCRGYKSDNRRHVYTGKVPAGMSDLQKKMCDIVDEMSTLLVPGKTAKEIYDRALALYEKNGMVPLLVNAGHTMGLNTEEVWMSGAVDLVLETGMVINIELYTDYPETGESVGDEETYLVTGGAPERITSLPREIIGT